MSNIKDALIQEQNIYNIFTRITGPYFKKIFTDLQNTLVEQVFYFGNLLKNPKYEYLFEIEQKKPYFYLDELENISNEKDSEKNNMIKAKNYISGLLYNCRDLFSSDFSSKNTLDILNDIKIFLKTSEFVLDNSLPYEWYVKSFLNCLKHLPQNLVENDFYYFYEEIKGDLNNSIKKFDYKKQD